MLGTLLRAWWLALAAVLAAAPAHARPAEANLLVLEVRLEGHVLSDSFNAYAEGADVLLPLGELARLLTLAITVRAERGSAAGFVVREDRTFGLNVAEGLVSVNGREARFDPRLAAVIGDEIYVARRLLERWLPVDLPIDLPTLELRVSPRERLPLQERLAREAAAGRLGAGSPAARAAGHVRTAAPYALADAPFIDQTFGLDARGGRGATRLQGHYTAYLTGDLLGMEGAAYVSAAQDRRDGNDVRITLARHDPEAGLLGPLRARSVVLGHITVPSIAHVMLASPAGAGFTLGNRALSQPTSFDRHSLRGDLPPGWDVTLYFNDALAGYQQAGADGRYAFDDLPLSFGINEFRLVFNGPLGQVRVERQRFLLDQPPVQPGEWVYALTHHRAEDGGLRSVAQVEAGLARGLAANAGFVRKPRLVTGEELRYTMAGVRGWWSSVIGSVQFVQAAAGGTLAELGLKTRLGHTAIDYAHTRRRGGFESELYPRGTEAIRSRDKLRLTGRLQLPALPPLTLALDSARDVQEAGAVNLGLAGRASALLGGTSISNSLRWGRVGGVEGADGSLQLARRMAGVGLNVQLGYLLRPAAEVQSLALSADHALASGWRLNAGLLRTLGPSHTLASAGMSRHFGEFGLGFNGSASSRGELTLGLQLFVAMGRDPRSGAWAAEALPLAGTGAVSARAFVDRNLNGVFDDGEEPIANAGFVLNGGGRHPVLTGPDGAVLISRLQPAQYTDVALDATTLDDPQWRPLAPGVRVLPRPGRVQRVDFPVVSTSDLDGTVWLASRGKRRPIGDAHVQLVDGSGTVVAETRSASDGYWLLHHVLPGRYTLRIAPEQAARLKLAGVLARPVDAPAEGDFIGGLDFELVAP